MTPVRNPETWRWLTPIFGVLNFTGIIIVGIVGFFMVRTIDQFDKHLEKIDIKFDRQSDINTGLEQQISFIKGRCCNQGMIKHQEEYKEDI